MNEAKAELLAYVESKEPRNRDKHRGLVAKMQGSIREFEKRVAPVGLDHLEQGARRAGCPSFRVLCEKAGIRFAFRLKSALDNR